MLGVKQVVYSEADKARIAAEKAKKKIKKMKLLLYQKGEKREQKIREV